METRPEDRPDRHRPAFGLPAAAPEQEGSSLTLDRLSAAFADMLDSGADPYGTASADQTAAEPFDSSLMESRGPASGSSACEMTPRSILEAMLFVGNPSGEPLSSRRMAEMMRGVRPAEIEALVRELNAAYERRSCPYTIVEEKGGYRMTLREEFARLRDRFHGRTRQARLSQAAIEVLAAVAYNQPVTSDDVARLRGTSSGRVLTQLVRRQLLRLERGTTRPRRACYSTTNRFLELFGLESLADLPRSHELEQP